MLSLSMFIEALVAHKLRRLFDALCFYGISVALIVAGITVTKIYLAIIFFKLQNHTPVVLILQRSTF